MQLTFKLRGWLEAGEKPAVSLSRLGAVVGAQFDIADFSGLRIQHRTFTEHLALHILGRSRLSIEKSKSLWCRFPYVFEWWIH